MSKADTLRAYAKLRPNIFCSIGKVVSPTDMSVDISAATCGRPAPCWTNVFPRGNTTKLGMSAMEPSIAE
ncbi:hypothetical protein bcgnr5387_47300 [Bacillus luti]